MAGAVAVRGLSDVLGALNAADKKSAALVYQGMRDLAEPVRLEAESLAIEQIRRIGPRWARMRTGVTRRVTYVAPKQRGVKTRGGQLRRRPNLGTLLAQKALEPALERHAGEFEARLEQILDSVANDFNRGGVR